jgi:hypothetical protein
VAVDWSIGERRSVIMRTVPARASSRYIFPVVLFAGILSLATRDLTDPDFWWHLRTGELIWQTHSVPHADPFSYALHGKPWIAHEWLAEVFFYAAYRAGGPVLLILIFALVTALAYFFLYCRCKAKPYVAGLLTVLGAMASIPTWGVRPQVLSLALASTFLFVLDRAQANRSLLWVLPALMLLWANLHGGFAVGLAFVAAYWLGSLLEYLRHTPDEAKRMPPVASMSIVLIATSLAVMVNPNGMRLYRYPVDTLRLTSLPRYVSEWRPPGLHEPRFLLFFLLLAATFVLLVVRRSVPQVPVLVLLIVTAVGAVRSVRHIPIFILMAVPVLSQQIAEVLAQRNWGRPLVTETAGSAANPTLNAVLFATALLFFAANILRVTRRQSEIESKNFPVGAVHYLQTHATPTPLLNNYNWGGYFIWKLYPHYLVWVDGRTDLYGDAFMSDFAELYKTEDDWRVKLDELGIRSVVLPVAAPLAQALAHDGKWQTAYLDAQSIVLVRASAGH